jgi:hypothetical protein
MAQRCLQFGALRLEVFLTATVLGLAEFSIDDRAQACEICLEHHVAHTRFQWFDRGFFADRARQDHEWNVEARLADDP